MNNNLLGSTVHWNMTIADYCRFHSVWQKFQPYVNTTLRTSRQSGKVVVAFCLYDEYALGLYIKVRIDTKIPCVEGTDVIYQHQH